MMQRRKLFSCDRSFTATASLAFAFLFATGCATGTLVSTAPADPNASAGKWMAGSVHGGQQPVTGAAMSLWAAGTTGTGAAGYGANAKLIASTLSDSTGSFSFNTAGASPCSAGQYLYITAVGGDTGSGVNSSSAMMAALPTPCGASTAGTFIVVDEVSTVAAVWALQQFMSILPGGTPAWQIGAPASNVTGLANAFLMTSNLSNLGGFTAASATSNTVSSNIAGVTYTTTVNPDFKKIDTLADILAYCINSPGTLCSSLFADVTPGTATAPRDTIQAAYYLATNPAGLTMPAHGDAQGSPYYLCSNYVSATPPFPATLNCTATSYPTDWMIGVQYTAVNSSGANAGTAYVDNLAIDGSGNVWTAYTTGKVPTAGLVSQMNVLGQVLMTPVANTTLSSTGGWYGSSYFTQNGGTASTIPLGVGYPNSLAIDLTGNAWYAGYYTAAVSVAANTFDGASGTLETPIAQITPSGVSTGYLVGSMPSAIAIDPGNNVWVSSATNQSVSSTAGRWYVNELVASSSPAYSTFNYGWDRQGGYFGQFFFDETANQYISPLYSSCNASIVQGNAATELANPVQNNSTNASTHTIALSTTSGAQTCITSGAPDASGNLWGTYYSGAFGYLEYINSSAGVVTGTPPTTTVTPVVSQFLMGNGTTQGGLFDPAGIAIDGIGNIWVANYVNSTSGGISEFAPGNNGTTVTPLSPAGTGVYGFGAAYQLPRPQELAIDPSGNIWIGTGSGATTITFMVGAAAPVVTPIAAAVAAGKIAVRP